MEIDSPTTPGTEIVPVTPIDNNDEPLTSEEQPNKRRRKKSIVWEHFTIETVGVGCMRACCKQCKKSFAYITGSKLAGTSHLKRHIALGICPVSNQKNGTPTSYTPGSKTDPPKKRFRAASRYSGIPFDQDSCTHELAKMIIQHEYPLHIVEHPAFVDFVRTLQPLYNMVSLDTIQGECVAVYLREKQNLFNLISEIPGRVSLTLDLGISNMNIGYAFLTGHFIDSDWNLHRRILNVVMLPFPDSDYAFNHAVASCLSEWHLERSLFSLTLDQSFSNETILGNLRGLLSVRNPFVLNGQLLKGNCYARVLSRLAQDALGAMGEVVRRIRESVKYVKTSETHNEKFTELRQQLQVPSTKDLIIDDQAKWNTTYEMLVAANELKEVFACLDTSDPFYKINPSDDDWKQVDILCGYLKLFFDAASILTSQSYPPAYAFYHEVSKIQLELTHAAMSQDPFISDLTRPLKEKFDQYWKESFLVLAIAVVMDPRFKMKLVEFSFSKIFGDEAGMWIKIVDDGVHELFYEYIAPSLSLPAASYSVGDVGIAQFETPQNPQDGQAVGVPPFEEHMQVVYSESVTSQEMHHQEIYPHQDMHTQEVPPQEMHDQVVPPKDVYQEFQNDEVPPQELQTDGVASQVVPAEEIHSVLTEDVPSQELQADGVPSEQVQTDVVSPEVTQSDVVHSKQVQSDDAPAQEMQTDEAPAQEMRTDEAPTQEMRTDEAPTQEMQTDETEMQTDDAPTQEMQTDEVPTQEMQTSEVPAEEIQSSEVPAEEMQTGEVPTEEMQTGEVPAEEMQSNEVPAEEMPTSEVPAEEMQSSEGPAEEMQSSEVPPEEMQSSKVPAEEMQSNEVPAEEMPTSEVPAEEMQTSELPAEEMQNDQVLQEIQTVVSPLEKNPEEMQPQQQETHTEQVLSQELPAQENTEEVSPTIHIMEPDSKPNSEEAHQEIDTKGVPSEEEHHQEMHIEVAPPHETHAVQTPSQETQTDAVPSQDGYHQEDHTEEMASGGVVEDKTEELPPQHLEIHIEEAPIQEEHAVQTDTQASFQGTQTDGPHQEEHNEEILSAGVLEMQTEELPPQHQEMQEIPSQQMHAAQESQPDEIHEPPSEQMHAQESHFQDMHNQEVKVEAFNQEMQSHEEHQDLPLLTIGNGLSDFDVYISEIANSQHLKSELDQYLEESLLPRVQEFDVLGWWKLNKLKYPTLSKMAADILSIPLSTVAPDSVFDTQSKKIGSYRSSLRPVTLEALICAKDWLQYAPPSTSVSAMDVSNALVKNEY